MSHSTSNLPTVNKLTMARNHTFTLIEMLVVVVIIGILAVTLIPRLVGAKERASDSARIVKVGQISSAVELYAQEQGSKYPLAVLTGAPGISIATPIVTNAISPYLTTIPTDPGKGTVAISTEPGGILATGDSFAYWTNDAGTGYAITALMESKKGNTTNGTGLIDSDKQGGYQKVGKGLTTSIVAGGGGGGGGGGPTNPETNYGPDIVISYGGTTYTIKDRNVGATQAGTGTASYGYYFQWGNNYGFTTVGTVTPNSTGTVNTSGYNGNYSSDIWIYGMGSATRYDWSSNQNDNLRGNTTNTDIARKGPCPSGYHVPTNAEWQGLYNTWKSIYNPTSNSGNLFRDTLKLPKAGWRHYGSASYISNQDVTGDYWSSTPDAVWGTHSYRLALSQTNVTTIIVGRGMGFSIRCFKNSP